MPIVVDKVQKRRDIALSCRDLLLENGIDNLTISQIAQSASVGKGTVYEYFENKEDIVFEIIATFLTEYQKRLEELASSPISTQQKLFEFCYTLFESEEGQKHLEIYKEFLAISLTHKVEAMLTFSERTRGEFRAILEGILAEGIASGELEEHHGSLAETLIVFSTGLMVDSRLSSFDVRHTLETLLDGLFGKGEIV
jgi:AcrR family transcriptional regulator